jgi:hypothetical protein
LLNQFWLFWCCVLDWVCMVCTRFRLPNRSVHTIMHVRSYLFGFLAIDGMICRRGSFAIRDHDCFCWSVSQTAIYCTKFQSLTWLFFCEPLSWCFVVIVPLLHFWIILLYWEVVRHLLSDITNLRYDKADWVITSSKITFLSISAASFT